jgi:hypothetical protein
VSGPFGHLLTFIGGAIAATVLWAVLGSRITWAVTDRQRTIFRRVRTEIDETCRALALAASATSASESAGVRTIARWCEATSTRLDLLRAYELDELVRRRANIEAYIQDLIQVGTFIEKYRNMSPANGDAYVAVGLAAYYAHTLIMTFDYAPDEQKRARAKKEEANR